MRRLLGANFGIAILCVGLFLPAPAAAQDVILIDSFDIPDPGVTNVTIASPAGGIARTNDMGGTILGSRDLSFSGVVNNTLSNNTYAIGNVPALPGTIFDMATNAQSSVTATLHYDTFGTLNLAGLVAFEFDFDIIDPGVPPGTTLEVEMTLSTGSGDLTAVAHFESSAAPGTFSIPAGAFSGPGSLSTVDGITVDLNNTGAPSFGVDFTLDEIRAITPEPGSIILWSVGALCVGGWYQRRRRLARQ
jgi:hypothetical protein